MKKLFVKFLIVSLLPFFFSCAASTNLTGFKNPDFKEKVTKILVYSLAKDLSLRQNIEQEVTNAFTQQNKKAFPSINLFSPVKSYTKEEIMNTIEREKFDAVLVLSVTDTETSETYIPPSQSTKTDGKGTVIGDYLYYKSTTKTETTGGFYVKKPIVYFESTLFYIPNDILIWKANSKTKGNAFANERDLAFSLGENILDDLISQKIIK